MIIEDNFKDEHLELYFLKSVSQTFLSKKDDEIIIVWLCFCNSSFMLHIFF